MKDKVETYIGFAIKKGSVVFGCDGIKKYRKKGYVLLGTKTLSQNSKDVLARCAENFCCPLIETDDYETLLKKNCKALAICDKSLATAILNETTKS